tara:strand:- start:4584 stop:4985 length:402 start_codon:yes stop_codon:yes gene_type:complete
MFLADEYTSVAKDFTLCSVALSWASSATLQTSLKNILNPSVLKICAMQHEQIARMKIKDSETSLSLQKITLYDSKEKNKQNKDSADIIVEGSGVQRATYIARNKEHSKTWFRFAQALKVAAIGTRSCDGNAVT